MPGLDGQKLDEILEAVERNVIVTTLEATNFNVTEAAGRLGITRSQLNYRMATRGIDRKELMGA